MGKCNSKKAKAAENEDFELAAKYKNKHTKLRSSLISFNDVKEMINTKPDMTMRQLLELMVQINPKFSLSFLRKMIENRSLLTKSYVLSTLM